MLTVQLALLARLGPQVSADIKEIGWVGSGDDDAVAREFHHRAADVRAGHCFRPAGSPHVVTASSGALPLRAPGWVGVNITSTAQFAPDASVEQALARPKSPLVVTPVTVTGKGNALVAVIVCGGLVVPRGRRGTFKL